MALNLYPPKNILDNLKEKLLKTGLAGPLGQLVSNLPQLQERAKETPILPFVPQTTPQNLFKVGQEVSKQYLYNPQTKTIFPQAMWRMPTPKTREEEIARATDLAIQFMGGVSPIKRGITKIPKQLEPLAQEARKYKSAEELWHSTDKTITNVVKAGKYSPQNYFGEGIYLGSKEGIYPGRNVYKISVPEGLKTLDLTKGNNADLFLQKVSKKIDVPIEKTGMGVYEDLRLMATKSSDIKVREAVNELTRGYEAIKSPLEYEGTFELVIRKPQLFTTDFYNQATRGLAKEQFEKKFYEAYQKGRPEKVKIEKPQVIRETHPELTIEEARKVAKMTDKELAEYNQATQGVKKAIPKLSPQDQLYFEQKGIKPEIPLQKERGFIKTVREAPKGFKMPPPQEPLTLPPGEIPKQFGKLQTFQRYAIRSITSSLKSMGRAGEQLAGRLDEAQLGAERQAGTAKIIIKKTTQNLNPTEKEALVQILDTGQLQRDLPAQSVDMTKVGKSVGILRSLTNSISRKAQEIGLEVRSLTGEKVPFTPRENYYPHIYPTSMFKGKGKADFINRLIETGQAQNVADAERILNSFIKGSRSVGNLEWAREIELPGYIRDPETALSIYVDRAYKRLNEATQLGAKDEIVKDLIEGIRTSGEDYQLAQAMFERVVGIEKRAPESLRDLLGSLRGINTITMLSLSAIQNLSQAANVVVRTNFVSAFKALKDIFKNAPQAREAALRSGAIFDVTTEMLEATRGLQASETLGSRFLKKVGFQTVEEFDRILGANAGRPFAQELFGKVLKNPRNLSVRRQLTKLGVDVEEALVRGKLNEKDLIKAGQTVANSSQFRYTPKDIPFFWSSPEGKVITQFKIFGRNHVKFLKEEVMEELIKHKNPGPLLRLAVVYPLVALPLKTMKDIITGKRVSDEEKSKLEQIAELYSWVGGLGIFTDVLRSASSGWLLEFGAGPTATTGVDLLESLAQMGKGGLSLLMGETEQAKGKGRAFGKFVTRRIPFVGPYLKETLFGKKPKKKMAL